MSYSQKQRGISRVCNKRFHNTEQLANLVRYLAVFTAKKPHAGAPCHVTPHLEEFRHGKHAAEVCTHVPVFF